MKKFILNQLEIKKNNIYTLSQDSLRNRHRSAEEVRTMRKNREIKLIFALTAVFFAGFLAVPMISVVMKSFTGNGEAASLAHYVEVLTGRGFLRALGHSMVISVCSALITTVLAFILAYAIHYTNLGKRYKWLISKAAILPMLLPTITYGFAIIYSFGKQGLLTKLFGRQLFDIYGFNGLLLGYVVYTLPIAFTLINNAMGYIDKRFMIVSRLMGDSPLQTFRMTIVISAARHTGNVIYTDILPVLYGFRNSGVCGRTV